MPDREKVIKWLEHCEFHLSKACLDCPYSKYNSRCLEAIKDDALALLREQEPVKPNPTGIEPNYNCGKCGLPIQQGYPFCLWCGRKVKWDADKGT